MHLAGGASLGWGSMGIKMRWLRWGKIREGQEHQIQEFGFQPSITENNKKVLD